jgi:hypothetical protein
VRSGNERTLEEMLAWLAQPGDAGPAAVRAKLQQWVPEYKPGG